MQMQRKWSAMHLNATPKHMHLNAILEPFKFILYMNKLNHLCLTALRV